MSLGCTRLDSFVRAANERGEVCARWELHGGRCGLRTARRDFGLQRESIKKVGGKDLTLFPPA